jgi:tetratricopeptide (TPR) repeat protein
VYELGFAYGWHQFRQKNKLAGDSGKDSEVPSIVCFAERNATVLVRNLYPEPMAVPTTTGSAVTILNPRLDLCKMFSDNSDLLISYYDRLNLIGSVEHELDRLVKAIRGAKSKQTIIRDVTLDMPSNEEKEQDWWQLYEQKRYVEVVNSLQKPQDFSQRKVLALSLMKLGRLYESIAIWNQLIDDADESHGGGVLMHLGICYYAVGELATAENYFYQAIEAGDDRAKNYLDRIHRRSSRRGSRPLENSNESSGNRA